MGEARKVLLRELRELISDPDELAKGTAVFDHGGIAHVARYMNKLFCEAKGSGPAPYRVQLVFGDSADEIKARCNCFAARTRPFCKHSAALLVAWARAPESFAVSDVAPPGAPGEAQKKKTVKKGKTSAAELAKGGVEQVATLIRELAVAGITSQAVDRFSQIKTLGENLRESRLRRLSARTLDLARMLEEAQSKSHGIDHVAYCDLLADMLLTVRKLEKHLEGEVLEDRYVEELIGKTWRKTDRKPVEALDLVEYAYSTRTTSDDFVIRESRFIDLASGTHYGEKQILPAFLAKRTEPKKSYPNRVLSGAKGSIYPGFSPHRLDLEDAGQATELDEAALARLVEKALPDVGAALAAFQERRKDVFAPDLLPVAVRVDTLLAEGSRLQVVDAKDHALFLPPDHWLDERLAATLRGARLVMLIGEIGLEGALPTLYPLAVVAQGPVGRELRSLAGSAAFAGTRKVKVAADRVKDGADPANRWIETARASGASTASISLTEVREELASLFANGLGALVARTTDPLVAKLTELGLAKQAELLKSIASRDDAALRLDDFVKLYRVLEIALVRLTGATHVDRASLEPVPTYESVFVKTSSALYDPGEVVRRRQRGELSRYQAAVHYARYYEQLPAEELVARIFPTWADGSASPYVARAFANRGKEAIAAAETALSQATGRVARLTAIRVLSEVGGPDAEAALIRRMNTDRDHALRLHAAEALDVLRRRSGETSLVGAKKRVVHERLAELAQTLLSGSQKEMRIEAARTMVNLHDLAAVGPLRLSFMGDISTDVREEAALALAQLGDTEMVETFVALLAARNENDDMAKTAAYALGHLGDVRGLDELLRAYAEGWKPVIVADALKAIGISAIEPVVRLVEAQPEIAKRKAALGVLEAMPPDALTGVLVRRISEAGERLAELAPLYLKLAQVHASTLRAVAQKVAALLETSATPAGKTALKAAKRALA